MRLILTICLISIGYVSAQYQDNYENSVNPYPKSQYDSGEVYSPPTRSQSYPPSRSSPSVYSKPKNIQPKAAAKLTAEEEEAAAAEEEKKPSELELLLANSKFSCANFKDGYYADNSAEIGCQVFHYCVGGAKHSWMCPKGTVFHQVHLNCVPAAQDICSQSEKYHIVNEYLHKPLEQTGPNQTVRYHQRYYPDEFMNYDASVPPNNGAQQYPPSRSSNSYNSYEDETPYRQPARSSNKPSYSSIPQTYPKPIVTTKPKPSYSSSGNYPVSLISSPQPSRKPSSASVYNDNNNYEDGPSFRSAPPIYSPPTPSARSQPSYQSNKPAYKPPTNNYQPSYKPSSLNSIKPSYSNYPNGARPSSGYETNNNNNNAKPYNDYSGVTYEEDENY